MSTLCFRIDSLTDDTLTLGIYDRNPMTLQLDATAKDGSQSSSTVDMSCLVDGTRVTGEMSCGGSLRNHGIRSVHLKCYDSNDTLLSIVSATVNSDGTFTATLPAGCDHFTVHYVESGTQPQYYEADIIASELAVGYAACDIRSGGEAL